MDDKTLKQTAQENGYSSELCTFLDKLETNIQLAGDGKYCVADALADGVAEYTVVKVALANIGRVFSDFYPDQDPDEKSPNEYTVDDWAKAGAEEFARHCTPAGRFRYSDFKYDPPPEYKPCGGLFG